MSALTITIKIGRSGGSFTAGTLRRSFPGCDISDERLGPAATLPRVFLHAYDGPRKQALAAHAPVKRFMDEVEAELARGPVVTTGSFTSHLVPVLADRFPGRLRVLAIFRHPLLSAAEHFLRGRYHGWPAWSIGDLACPTPFDPGMLAQGFRARWPTMSPYEKNLYRWVEYVTLSREVERRYPGVPMLRVRTEDLFDDPETWIERIARFAGLDGPIAIGTRPRHGANPNGARRYPLRDQWRAYRRHPEVAELAAFLGYTLDEAHIERELERYQPPDSAAYRLLFAARWYHVKGYLAHRVRPRFWRDHWRVWQAERQVNRRRGEWETGMVPPSSLGAAESTAGTDRPEATVQ